MLDRMGVPRSAYDAIVTSGDVTRDMVAQARGRALLPDRPGARPHDLHRARRAVQHASKTARYVICTGLFDDEIETPDDYRDLLQQLRARNLFFLCANPDIVVERGEQLIYCAGALADAYAELGGEVYYAGKPHRPLYDLALAEVNRARRSARSAAPSRSIACWRSAIRCARI